MSTTAAQRSEREQGMWLVTPGAPSGRTLRLQSAPGGAQQSLHLGVALLGGARHEYDARGAEGWCRRLLIVAAAAVVPAGTNIHQRGIQV